MTNRLLCLFGAVAMFALSPAWAQVREPEIVRDGAARAALDRMELAPVPAGLWDALSDWSGGAAPDPASLSGKVVLIVNYASWHAPSMRAFRQASRLAQEHAHAGLVVIAAHHAQGFADADKPKPTDAAPLHVAHDSKGDFRRLLNAGQDPSFFLIDRSGQVRFAGIATMSVAGAVEKTLAETAEQAAGLKERLEQQARQRREEALRPESIREKVDLARLPEIPFQAPPPEAYQRARWPKFPRLGDQASQQQPEQDPTRPAGVPDAGWFPEKPPTAGRITVLYFWTPGLPRTYDPVMRNMDVLAKQLGRDGVVAGVYTFVSTNSWNPSPRELEERDPAKVHARLQAMRSSMVLSHPQILDLDGGLLQGVRTGSQSGNEIPMPYAAIVSSDGMLRWSGPLHHPSFQGALEQVLQSDPGVAARRAAEARYIRERDGN
jgi:thiol-disulfide isomerase/thioredoxin